MLENTVGNNCACLISRLWNVAVKMFFFLLGHHDFRLVVIQLLIRVPAPKLTFGTAAFFLTVGSLPISLCVMQ